MELLSFAAEEKKKKADIKKALERNLTALLHQPLGCQKKVSQPCSQRQPEEMAASVAPQKCKHIVD